MPVSRLARPMVLNSIVLLMCMALLLGLAVSSLSALMADVQFAWAKQTEQRWFRHGRQLTETGINPKEWQAARDHLYKALWYSPGHPDYLRALGRLSSWSYWVFDQPDQAAINQQGLEALRQALQSRPYWSNAWSELAILKVQAGAVDEPFWRAMQASDQTGSWERQALVNRINAGLAAWRLLSPQQQSELLSWITEAVQSVNWYDFSARVLAKLQQLGLKQGVCSSLNERTVAQHVINLCQRK